MRASLVVKLVASLATLLAMAGVAGACGDGEESVEAPQKVVFMAGFKPQANLPFVGAYVAQEKGFFAEQGLEVEIRHVTTPGENFRFLAVGEVQFSTADAAVVLERRASDPSLPVVAIALIGQRGQQGFAVLADSGIESPKDWEGKTAGYKGTEPTPDYFAILAANGVERSEVKEIRVGFDPRILTNREVDIFPVFVSNEPDTLRNLGFEVKLFEAADYGVPTLGLTYVTSEKFLGEKPEVVERFLKAALKGIEYARENPQEAIDIVLKFAPMEEREHMRFMFETELEAALAGEAGGNGVGWMTDEQWRNLHELLVQYKGIAAPLEDLSAAYTDEFVRRIYNAGRVRWP